jgi:hypothetical protein
MGPSPSGGNVNTGKPETLAPHSHIILAANPKTSPGTGQNFVRGGEQTKKARPHNAARAGSGDKLRGGRLRAGSRRCKPTHEKGAARGGQEPRPWGD